MNDSTSKPWWRLAWSGLWMTAAAFLVFELFIRGIAFFHPIYDVEMMKYAKALKVASPVPTLIRQHRPNSKAHLMGVDVTLNSLGHRSPELKVPKPLKESRIHFVGSSILMAWGVEEDKGMVALVEKRLNKEKSPQTRRTYVGINAGIGNFNTYYEVELFESQVEQTKPDMVVLQYYVNDSEPNPADRDNPIFMDSVALALTYLRIKAAMATGGTTLEEYYGALYKDGQPDWERTKAALIKLKKICDERGVPLVVLLVPEVHNFSADSPYRMIYGILDSLFKNLNIPFINPVDDLLQAFGPHPKETSVARDDPHPNAPAHKVMANTLSNYLLTLDF